MRIINSPNVICCGNLASGVWGFSPLLRFPCVAFKLPWSSHWLGTDHNKNIVDVFKCSITYRRQFMNRFSQSLLFIIEKHIRPLYHLILLCCFIYLVLSVFFRPARVTGLALCWSWEIDNALETRNKNAARGRDTRIHYYANTGVILKTNRWLLFPYIPVLYVSVSPENETFNVSSTMMDLTFYRCNEWRGLKRRKQNARISPSVFLNFAHANCEKISEIQIWN